MTRRVNLGGFLPVEVVSDEEAEKASVAVCAPLGPSQFTDNEIGRCAICHCWVMFRPYMPKKPRKVCLKCVLGLIEEQKAQ